MIETAKLIAPNVLTYFAHRITDASHHASISL